MNRSMRLLSGLVLLTLVVIPANIFSCMNLVENRFTSKRMPEVPQQPYVNGKLGLLWPTFERRYLVIAYRYLDGKPLSAVERDSLINGTTPILIPGGMAPPDSPVTLWLKARSHALGLKEVRQLEIQQWKMQGFNGYPNCGDDAFTKAAATVADRAQKFGAGSAAMQDWVSAQDAVFLNCGSADDFRWHPPDQPPPPKVLHTPPPATLNNALLKFDRKYQIAAANFYFGDFAAAAASFEAIAREPDSPWRTLAPYLVARCYVRQATLDPTGEQVFNPETMHAAEKQLQAILADKSLASIHPAAQSLLDYVDARLYPEQRLHALALELVAGVGNRMNTRLFDYTYLLDHVLSQQTDVPGFADKLAGFKGPATPATYEDAVRVDSWRSAAEKNQDTDDLTDWVLTFQLDGSLSNAHRLERWQATKSLPWLLSALVATHADDPHAAEIASAAASIAPDSPAYDTALYHRVRLLMEQDRHDHARKLLDTNLERIEALPPADRNPFFTQRLALAQNYEEFLRFAPRTPVELDDYIGKLSVYCDNRGCNNRFGQTTTPPPPRLQLDSVAVFNQDLPLSMLVQAAIGTALPPDLRHELAARTWLRAAILDDTSITRQIGPAVVEAYPDFRPYIETHDRADSAAARKFAVVYMLVHFSGLQPFVNAGAFGSVIRPGIDSYVSWWCYDVGSMQEHRPNQNYAYSAAGSTPSVTVEVGAGEHPATPPTWIPKAVLAEGQKQAASIAAIGPAPLYFAPVVLGWAKAHPDDPRVPEALHYFVRATRYGCVDKSIGPYSRRAFNLLHDKYPDSEWTKKTPYWYG
jgi:tetratricopeptide (TPR) repeat protein